MHRVGRLSKKDVAKIVKNCRLQVTDFQKSNLKGTLAIHFSFDNHKIYLENSVTLLGIEIDNKLNFKKHVTTLYQKADRQLNAMSRILKYIGFQEMKMLLDSFIFSNFNYCSLVWHFCIAALSQKIEKYGNVLWGYCIIAVPVTAAYS